MYPLLFHRLFFAWGLGCRDREKRAARRARQRARDLAREDEEDSFLDDLQRAVGELKVCLFAPPVPFYMPS
jgi:hypothetical protein